MKPVAITLFPYTLRIFGPELGGYNIPSTMQGTSLLENASFSAGADPGLSPDEESLIRERLSGLGYIA